MIHFLTILAQVINNLNIKYSTEATALLTQLQPLSLEFEPICKTTMQVKKESIAVTSDTYLGHSVPSCINEGGISDLNKVVYGTKDGKKVARCYLTMDVDFEANKVYNIVKGCSSFPIAQSVIDTLNYITIVVTDAAKQTILSLGPKTMSIIPICASTNKYDKVMLPVDDSLFPQHVISVCADKGGVKLPIDSLDNASYSPSTGLYDQSGKTIGYCNLSDDLAGLLV